MVEIFYVMSFFFFFLIVQFFQIYFLTVATPGDTIPGLGHFENPNCLSCGAGNGYVSKLFNAFGAKSFTVCVLSDVHS